VVTAVGGIGLAIVGPLVATLLVGRTGIIPSVRWLLVALGAWAIAGAVGWFASRSHPLRSLALLGIVAPLLPVLYLSDEAYHLASTGNHAPVIMGYASLLAVAGGIWSGFPQQRAGRQLVEPSAGRRFSRPVSGWGTLVLGVLLMVATNDLIFEPLGTAERPEQVLFLIVNIVSLAASAWIVASLDDVPYGWLGALCLFITWAAFGSWQEMLAHQPVGMLFLLGAAGLSALAFRRWLVAATLCGVLAGIAPPAIGMLVIPFFAKKIRPGIVGLGIATVVLLARYVSIGALPNFASALAGTPHRDNVALAAFHLRLFVGAGHLTEGGVGPVNLAALSLTLGALATGSALLVVALRSSVRHSLNVETASVLALLGGLLLAGTTTQVHLALAGLALVPLSRTQVWLALSPRGRWLVLIGAVPGFALAGTSPPRLAQAAAELLSAWPAAASLQTLGLVLLLVSLLRVMRAIAVAPNVIPPGRIVVANPSPLSAVDTAAAAARG
jgi:hypothetical protein